MTIQIHIFVSKWGYMFAYVAMKADPTGSCQLGCPALSMSVIAAVYAVALIMTTIEIANKIRRLYNSLYHLPQAEIHSSDSLRRNAFTSVLFQLLNSQFNRPVRPEVITTVFARVLVITAVKIAEFAHGTRDHLLDSDHDHQDCYHQA